VPFVAFEGIDGTGKSTALAAVAAALRAEGRKVHATREETEGPTGEAVRRSVRERWDPLATTFLFVADRARHLAELRPRLAAGELVLCDRFLHSTYAYQSVTLEGHVPDPVRFLEGLHEGWCPLPDRVVLLTMPVEEAVRRAEGRGATTPYEKAAFLHRVQERYLDMARRDGGRFVVLDAARAPAAVAADALAAVRGVL
jgi:dTMP kinase